MLFIQSTLSMSNVHASIEEYEKINMLLLLSGAHDLIEEI